MNYEHVPAKDQIENTHVLVRVLYCYEFTRMSSKLRENV